MYPIQWSDYKLHAIAAGAVLLLILGLIILAADSGGDTATRSRKRCCPEGYTRAGSSRRRCFKLYERMMRWREAEAHCGSALGAGGRAHLASIVDEAEYDFVIMYLANKQDYHVWVGANDIDQEGVWKFTDGTDTAFITTKWWRPDQPDNWAGEDCGMVKASGLNDLDCDLRRHFVCSVRAKTTFCH